GVSAVVCPEPRVPSRTRIWPGATERESASRAAVPPGYRLLTPASAAAGPVSSAPPYQIEFALDEAVHRRFQAPRLPALEGSADPPRAVEAGGVHVDADDVLAGRDVEDLVVRALPEAEVEDLLRDLARDRLLQDLLVVHEDAQGAAAQRMLEVDLEMAGLGRGGQGGEG